MRHLFCLCLAASALAASGGCVHVRNRLESCADRLVHSDAELAKKCLCQQCGCNALSVEETLDAEIQLASYEGDSNEVARQRLDALREQENLTGFRHQVQELRQELADRNQDLMATRREMQELRHDLDLMRRQFSSWQQGLEELQTQISEREQRRDAALDQLNRSLQPLLQEFQDELVLGQKP